nr:DUF1461 domain-containing protein [Candidatus Woesearchaeota archaeon]
MKKLIFLQALFLGLFVILFGFRFVVFDLDFYMKFNDNKEDTLKIIEYLQEGKPLNGFTDREIAHMSDVKRIIDVFLLVFYLSFVFFIFITGFLIYENKFDKKIFIYGALFVVVFLLIMFLLSLNFQSLFLNFHEVFFEDNSWVFNQEDKLANLFPEDFFKSALSRILTIDFILAFFAVIIGLVSNKNYRHNI